MRNNGGGEVMERGMVANDSTVLELTVNNHPGVMSHICGLFSRRAYNVEGIVCLPMGSGERSRIWLRVNESTKLMQVMKQLEKLPDVFNVARLESGDDVFTGLMERAIDGALAQCNESCLGVR